MDPFRAFFTLAMSRLGKVTGFSKALMPDLESNRPDLEDAKTEMLEMSGQKTHPIRIWAPILHKVEVALEGNDIRVTVIFGFARRDAARFAGPIWTMLIQCSRLWLLTY
jgi:hypothetical protein